MLDGKPILNLPARIVQVVQCPFDAEERAFYTALEQKTELTFNKVCPRGASGLILTVPAGWCGHEQLHLGADHATSLETR
jgi:hypothetical protein